MLEKFFLSVYISRRSLTIFTRQLRIQIDYIVGHDRTPKRESERFAEWEVAYGSNKGSVNFPLMRFSKTIFLPFVLWVGEGGGPFAGGWGGLGVNPPVPYFEIRYLKVLPFDRVSKIWEVAKVFHSRKYDHLMQPFFWTEKTRVWQVLWIFLLSYNRKTRIITIPQPTLTSRLCIALFV